MRPQAERPGRTYGHPTVNRSLSMTRRQRLAASANSRSNSCDGTAWLLRLGASAYPRLSKAGTLTSNHSLCAESTLLFLSSRTTPNGASNHQESVSQRLYTERLSSSALSSPPSVKLNRGGLGGRWRVAKTENRICVNGAPQLTCTQLITRAGEWRWHFQHSRGESSITNFLSTASASLLAAFPTNPLTTPKSRSLGSRFISEPFQSNPPRNKSDPARNKCSIATDLLSSQISSANPSRQASAPSFSTWSRPERSIVSAGTMNVFKHSNPAVR